MFNGVNYQFGGEKENMHETPNKSRKLSLSNAYYIPANSFELSE